MSKKIAGVDFVGQEAALTTIDTWKARDTFPHFLLIVGDEGSGKRLLAYHMATVMDCRIAVLDDLNAASIRDLVATAYNIDSKILYLLPDADKLSNAASSALLKFTEEPPPNAYIVMTLQSLENTLYTLQSRSQHLLLAPYSPEQLGELCDDERLCNLAATPGMLKKLQHMAPEEVDKLVNLCNTLIARGCDISLCNALKSASVIKFKETDKGPDIGLVLSALSYELNKRIASGDITGMSNSLTDDECIITSEWLRALSIYKKKFARNGVSKKALYDMMLIDVRTAVQRRRSEWTSQN